MNALDKLASRMTFGVELPLDNDWSAGGRQKAAADGRPFGVPDVSRMTGRVLLAESLGFEAAWVRDVPVHDPNFGDAGSVFDPFPLLGFLAGKTSRMILGTAAIVVPLRDPIHLAKMAASVHELSNHRFVMGVASGDRPVEYPLMNVDFESRGDRLRESLSTIRHLWRGGGLQGAKGKVTVRPFVGDGPPIVMAGMGQHIGARFQELGGILERVDSPRLKVCLDTQHTFAAGYDLTTSQGIEATIAEFDHLVGVENLVAVHANDSKRVLGSGVDRHDNIGEGFIGEEGFEVIMGTPAFRDVPFFLEVPGFDGKGPDSQNIKILKDIRQRVGLDS